MRKPAATFNGKPCKKCGGTIRYVKEGRCVPCLLTRLAASARAWRERDPVGYRLARYKATKTWRERNPEEARERDRKHSRLRRQRHPQAVREQSWKAYGILFGGRPLTWDVFSARLRAQGGGCAICGVPLEAMSTAANADHDPRTGEFRGVLCGAQKHRCNQTLGSYEKRGPLFAAYLSGVCDAAALDTPRTDQYECGVF